MNILVQVIDSKLRTICASFLSQELPERWKNLKKIAFIVKHEVSPLQANEVSVIRRKCVLFEVRSLLCSEANDFFSFCSNNKLEPSFTELRNCKLLEKRLSKDNNSMFLGNALWMDLII